MQKLKKKLATFVPINRSTIKSNTTARKIPKGKPAKKIVQQNSGTVEKIITQKSHIAAAKLPNQIPEEKFVTPKLETTASATPLREEYEKRPLPGIPNEYGNEDAIPYIDEEMSTSDLGIGIYDEIYETASIGNESHSIRSSVGDSGIDNTSVPNSAISNIDTKNASAHEIDSASETGSISTDGIAAYILSSSFKASKGTRDSLLSIKQVTDEQNVQIGQTSELEHTTEPQKSDRESFASTDSGNTIRNEAIVKRPPLPEIFDAIYNSKWIKGDKSIDPINTNSISIKEQNKDSAESEITSSQSQNSLLSGNAQKEAHIQESHTSSTSVNEEQVGNIPSGVKAFTHTSRNKHENKESEPIYLDPWDLKPIPELDEHQHTGSMSSSPKRTANEPSSSIYQEEEIYESLDDIEAYLASPTHSFEQLAEKAHPALRAHREKIDDKSEHVYAQVKRNNNVRSDLLNLEDGAITADIFSVTIPKLHLKEHTVDVSLPKTQQKTITETPISTRKALSQGEETHKTVPNKSWLRRILDRIKEIFLQGYAALRSIFTQSTKNKEKSFDQSPSSHSKNGELSKIEQTLSERHPLNKKETGALNAIKEALSQKHALVLGKAGELGKIKETLSEKHALVLGKAGELGKVKEALSQKHALVLGKAGELGKIKETLSEKHALVLRKAGELGKVKEALSEKHALVLGKARELGKVKEALSQKVPLIQEDTMRLSKIREALSEKGFRVHHLNYEQNKAHDNPQKNRYAFSTGTEHDKIKSILTREPEITAKLRESGMKEEQSKTCVPSLGCNSHTRTQASRVV
ncbi:hypothetical protein [Neorickettsia sennetsu]|nr:hypothetical protein [Neorickettsia sennetsu]